MISIRFGKKSEVWSNNKVHHLSDPRRNRFLSVVNHDLVYHTQAWNYRFCSVHSRLHLLLHLLRCVVIKASFTPTHLTIHPNAPNCGMSTANYFVTMYETPTPLQNPLTPCNSPHACTSVLYVAWLYQCLFWIMSIPLCSDHHLLFQPTADSTLLGPRELTNMVNSHPSRFPPPLPPILSDIVLIACLPHLQLRYPPVHTPSCVQLHWSTAYGSAFRHNETQHEFNQHSDYYNSLMCMKIRVIKHINQLGGKESKEEHKQYSCWLECGTSRFHVPPLHNAPHTHVNMRLRTKRAIVRTSFTHVVLRKSNSFQHCEVQTS
jgi:hypothetical protein